jgi:hypothetical protein
MHEIPVDGMMAMPAALLVPPPGAGFTSVTWTAVTDGVAMSAAGTVAEALEGPLTVVVSAVAPKNA